MRALHRTAALQAAQRQPATATLLADAPATDRNTVQGPADGQVLTLATWPARDGSLHHGCLPSIVAILHLIAVRAIDAARDRRWTAEWASVEPLWAGRSS